MSLGETTNCDLSAGIAKIDRRELIASLWNYIRCLEREITDLMNKYTSFEIVSHDGSIMELKIKELRRVAELHYTLFVSTKDDRKITWID